MPSHVIESVSGPAPLSTMSSETQSTKERLDEEGLDHAALAVEVQAPLLEVHLIYLFRTLVRKKAPIMTGALPALPNTH